jgi:hypothetical protein
MICNRVSNENEEENWVKDDEKVQGYLSEKLWKMNPNCPAP